MTNPPNRADLPAVILAGGKSSRMGGGDKGLLTLGGRRLIDRVIDRIGAQAGPLVLNVNGDAARMGCDLPAVPDSISEFPGPLAGVLAGMDWAAEQGFDHIVSVAADTPFFPTDLVARLSEAGPLALAATQEGARVFRQPTFGIWPTALRNDLRDALRDGLRKVVIWTDRHGAQDVIWGTEPHDPFFNINTPEDMTKAEALL